MLVDFQFVLYLKVSSCSKVLRYFFFKNLKGALFVILNPAPNLKMLGLLQVIFVPHAWISLNVLFEAVLIFLSFQMLTVVVLSFLDQGFAAGLMLSISFFDLAHNALNSIGFLRGNLWVGLPSITNPYGFYDVMLVE